jgi:hypothetical protein
MTEKTSSRTEALKNLSDATKEINNILKVLGLKTPDDYEEDILPPNPNDKFCTIEGIRFSVFTVDLTQFPIHPKYVENAAGNLLNAINDCINLGIMPRGIKTNTIRHQIRELLRKARRQADEYEAREINAKPLTQSAMDRLILGNVYLARKLKNSCK